RAPWNAKAGKAGGALDRRVPSSGVCSGAPRPLVWGNGNRDGPTPSPTKAGGGETRAVRQLNMQHVRFRTNEAAHSVTLAPRSGGGGGGRGGGGAGRVGGSLGPKLGNPPLPRLASSMLATLPPLGGARVTEPLAEPPLHLPISTARIGIEHNAFFSPRRRRAR